MLAGVVALCAQGGMFGAVFLLTQFMQDVLGYSPLDAGLRTLPWTLAPAAVAPLAAVLADRAGLRMAMAVTTALQIAGMAWFALVVAPDVPYLALVPPMLLAGTGMGLFFALSPRQALDFVTPAEHGIASGINNALRQVGVVLGIAVLGSVFAATGGYADAAELRGRPAGRAVGRGGRGWSGVRGRSPRAVRAPVPAGACRPGRRFLDVRLTAACEGRTRQIRLRSDSGDPTP